MKVLATLVGYRGTKSHHLCALRYVYLYLYQGVVLTYHDCSSGGYLNMIKNLGGFHHFPLN